MHLDISKRRDWTLQQVKDARAAFIERVRDEAMRETLAADLGKRRVPRLCRCRIAHVFTHFLGDAFSTIRPTGHAYVGCTKCGAGPGRGYPVILSDIAAALLDDDEWVDPQYVRVMKARASE